MHKSIQHTGSARAKWTFWNGSNSEKKVAISKVMVASNSQQKYNFKYMVSFHVPIRPLPQWPHVLQKPLCKRVDIGHSIPATSIPVLCEVAEAKIW